MKLKLNDKRDNQAVLKPWETQGPRMRPFRETKLGVSRECVPPHYEPGAFSLSLPLPVFMHTIRTMQLRTVRARAR